MIHDLRGRIALVLDEHDAMFKVVIAVLEWARTPGDHGGNPYMHQFVREARAAYELVTGKEYGE